MSTDRLVRLTAVVTLALVLFGVTHPALAQTPGVITLTVTPASGIGSVTPTVAWSTTPNAQSCVASGGWSGTKAAQGSQVQPATTSSKDFTLTCTWAAGATGTADVSWTAPTQNTDGSPLRNLASYKVYYGTSASALTQVVQVAAPTLTARVASLTPGTWYFGVRAVNTSDVESDTSTIVSKAIQGPAPPTASKTVSLIVNPKPGAPGNVTVIETTAYNVKPDFQKFAFVRGARAGSVKLGSACDKSRQTSDGYMVISRLTQVTPRPQSGTVLVARCG